MPFSYNVRVWGYTRPIQRHTIFTSTKDDIYIWPFHMKKRWFPTVLPILKSCWESSSKHSHQSSDSWYAWHTICMWKRRSRTSCITTRNTSTSSDTVTNIISPIPKYVVRITCWFISFGIGSSNLTLLTRCRLPFDWGSGLGPHLCRGKDLKDLFSDTHC